MKKYKCYIAVFMAIVILFTSNDFSVFSFIHRDYNEIVCIDDTIEDDNLLEKTNFNEAAADDVIVKNVSISSNYKASANEMVTPKLFASSSGSTTIITSPLRITSGVGYPGDVIIKSSVTIDAGASMSVAGSVYLEGGSITANGVLSVNGAILIDNGAIVSTESIYCGSSFNINGTVIAYATIFVNDSIYLESGSLTLNDSTTVNGSVLIERGILVVNENMLCYGNFQNGINSTGYTRINAGAKLTVYGDFYTQSTASTY
ncbi:MAG: hypothetical protein FWG70_05330, partial [Oscillospiraceae bacterium]|nr:hypothetical protein [Oscillospiraceae bacterium]